MSRRSLLRSCLGLLAAMAGPRSFALYDPAPNPLLTPLPGTWRGALTYRDWSPPGRLETLPCRLQVSLLAPAELSLYFVFDDGPGKTVHAYDRWRFDFAGAEMVWVAGGGKEQTAYRIDAASATDEGLSVVLAREADGKRYRQRLDVAARTLKLTKVEIAADGQEIFRNGYEMTRADA